jgi:hypothetical protein
LLWLAQARPLFIPQSPRPRAMRPRRVALLAEMMRFVKPLLRLTNLALTAAKPLVRPHKGPGAVAPPNRPRTAPKAALRA